MSGMPSEVTVLLPQQFRTICHLGTVENQTSGLGGCWRPGQTRADIWRVPMTTGDLLETIGTDSCHCLSLPFG